jgi:diguanylate cyclase
MKTGNPLYRTGSAKGSDDLFARIGEFLWEQRLSPDPQHYAFAHRIMTDRNSALAKAVATITDGGVRLSRSDIEKLGGTIAPTAIEAATARETNDKLVAKTQMQVDGFTDMVVAMRAETEDFGRDLAASADAMRNAAAVPDDVVRLTGAMLDRVRTAESRLEAATHEATELRAKLEEARDNARRDPLTDLPNRRAFEEAFAAGVAKGERMCIAVCDVDHFKQVNDRFGHAVGDRVLKAIAEALTTTCSEHVVARYGGEEFAILFTGIDRVAALDTLELARKAVAAKRYRLRESDQPLGEVTFSAGLTCAEEGEGLGTVFGRSDKLLYAAKHAGRNQVQIG